jgi:hypothetical protein
MAKSKKEERDLVIIDSLDIQAIEDGYFRRERNENLAAQGLEINIEDLELVSYSQDEKDQWRRDKILQQIEAERTDRTDLFRKDSDGNTIYDGGDPDGINGELICRVIKL